MTSSATDQAKNTPAFRRRVRGSRQNRKSSSALQRPGASVMDASRRASLRVGSGSDEVAVAVRTAVAVELPDVADFADLVEVEIGDDQLVLVAGTLRDNLSARVGEIALSIELADVPRRLGADAVDRADEVAVGRGV